MAESEQWDGGFDSSDDGDEVVDMSPFPLHWLNLEFLGSEERLGISGLPGCRFKDTWRSLKNDLHYIKSAGVNEIFCLCTKGEMSWFRTPELLQEMSECDITVHHYGFADGSVPTMADLMKMLDQLKVNMMNGKKSLVHCSGGLGRSCLVAVCLMMLMDEALSSDNAIEKVRELRGPGAIQSVKQYNFINEFRGALAEYSIPQEGDRVDRSLSR